MDTKETEVAEGVLVADAGALAKKYVNEQVLYRKRQNRKMMRRAGDQTKKVKNRKRDKMAKASRRKNR